MLIQKKLFLNTPVSDSSLTGVAEKITNHTRLDSFDAKLILNSSDIHLIGAMAEYKKKVKSGNLIYFTVNKHINYTNVCRVHCQVCAFKRGKHASDAYVLDIDHIINSLKLYGDNLDEVHIVGGLNPDLPFDYYISMIKIIKTNFPGITVKAFTATEINFFASLYKTTIHDVLSKLLDAGLDTMPGGGAEMLSDHIRAMLFKGKEQKDVWLETHRTAHSLGIKTNATMLYGHIETDDDIINHLEELRKLQDQTYGFLTFVPLVFHPDNTPMYRKVRTPSAIRKLKIIALSRLYLDNFPHIKAYWVMLSEGITQIALHFGADDIDGTIGEEKVTHAAGAKTPYGLAKDKMVNIIKDAGYVPAQRDGIYKIIKLYDK
ncbi:MAG: CofH family radical SAM protein [Deltaproteobacteria bacterium]|nr:CofH family radical SAM protein [Deltaproteobacteria bacterium]MCL5791654.1 CofH family radical SAM protein [Deltaproteobacteria bacterium]